MKKYGLALLLVLIPTLATAGLKADISWVDNSVNETKFQVERKAGTGTFQLLVETAANVTTFADTNITPGTTYSWRIRACNALGCSGYSSEAVATAPDIPTAPGTVTVIITVVP